MSISLINSTNRFLDLWRTKATMQWKSNEIELNSSQPWASATGKSLAGLKASRSKASTLHYEVYDALEM